MVTDPHAPVSRDPTHEASETSSVNANPPVYTHPGCRLKRPPATDYASTTLHGT
jgi:hypothetical protein